MCVVPGPKARIDGRDSFIIASHRQTAQSKLQVRSRGEPVAFAHAWRVFVCIWTANLWAGKPTAGSGRIVSKPANSMHPEGPAAGNSTEPGFDVEVGLHRLFHAAHDKGALLVLSRVDDIYACGAHDDTTILENPAGLCGELQLARQNRPPAVHCQRQQGCQRAARGTPPGLGRSEEGLQASPSGTCMLHR